MKTYATKIVGLLFFTAALLAGGCASPAQSKAMVAVPTMGSVKSHDGKVSLNVTGGSETSAMGASQISSADFATALRDSIQKSGLFSAVVAAGGDEDYHIEVAIVRVDQPMMGFSMTVTFETTWTLSGKNDQTVFWRKAISSRFTATVGDAFAGVTRLRLANEGAARENIQEAIAQMSALTLH